MYPTTRPVIDGYGRLVVPQINTQLDPQPARPPVGVGAQATFYAKTGPVEAGIKVDGNGALIVASVIVGGVIGGVIGYQIGKHVKKAA